MNWLIGFDIITFNNCQRNISNVLGGNNKTVVWSAACPISDLFGKGDRYWA